MDPLLIAQTELLAAGLRQAVDRPSLDFALPTGLAGGGRSLEAAVEFGRQCLESMVEADTPAEKLAHMLRIVAYIQDKVRSEV